LSNHDFVSTLKTSFIFSINLRNAVITINESSIKSPKTPRSPEGDFPQTSDF